MCKYIESAAIAVIIGWLYAEAGGDDLRAATAATKSRRAFAFLSMRERITSIEREVA
jgi:hypothetical protein